MSYIYVISFYNGAMTTAKTELFSKELQITAGLFKLFSHPARLAILNYLSDTKMCITGDIFDELPLSRTTVIQHVNELKDFGLIKGEIEGVKVKYCLNPEKINFLKKVINQFVSNLNKCKNKNC